MGKGVHSPGGLPVHPDSRIEVLHFPGQDTDATITGTTIADNTAGSLGGGVFSQGSILALTASQFFENEVSPGVEENEYESVEQMRGSMSQQNVAQPAAFERANYMKVLQSWSPDPTGQLL